MAGYCGDWFFPFFSSSQEWSPFDGGTAVADGRSSRRPRSGARAGRGQGHRRHIHPLGVKDCGASSGSVAPG